MLVVDANVVVEVTLERFGVMALDALCDEQLVAPWLLWSEVPAALSAMVFRAEISCELGESALKRLETIRVEPLHPDGLVTEAWRIAKERGWAKTYDAEYLALARLLGCRLTTLDGPLWRATLFCSIGDSVQNQYLHTFIKVRRIVPFFEQQHPRTHETAG